MSGENELTKASNDLYRPVEGEEVWQKRARILKQQRYFGSFLPPIDTEPFPHERNRLATSMTDADRAARKQFFQDQLVSKTEPRNVPALDEVNIFRKVYRKPLGLFTSGLAKLVGERPAYHVTTFGKIVLGTTLAFYTAMYIHLYKEETWTGESGNTKILQNKSDFVFNDPIVEKRKQDFFDDGFSSRKSHRDGKTSSSGSWGTD